MLLSYTCSLDLISMLAIIALRNKQQKSVSENRKGDKENIHTKEREYTKKH